MSRDLVFISYSHKDQKWLEALKTHLFPIINNDESLLKVWDDEQIAIGSMWEEEIKTALRQTKIAVLLVSPDFLASTYIKDNELPPLLDAANANEANVFWIPIRPSNYKFTKIKKYQAAWSPDRPIGGLSEAEQDEAWVKITQKLDEAYKLINPQ